MSAEGAVDTRPVGSGGGLQPRAAFRAFRALEAALFAPAADGYRLSEAVGALEEALLAPTIDERAVLEAVRRLEEAAG